MTLLEKDPRKRIGYADVVGTILANHLDAYAARGNSYFRQHNLDQAENHQHHRADRLTLKSW